MAMTVHRAGIRLTSGSEEGRSRRSNIRANSNDTPQPADTDGDERSAHVSEPVADISRSSQHERLMELVEDAVRSGDHESERRDAKHHTTWQSSSHRSHTEHRQAGIRH